ncbi:hypothetical protein EF405_08045 [Cyclobacteriaceae bacterium YHN15]|nr:hypothetical protein EF405_08045 [Cyclobacteriaceae bacterium YHN15]
MLKFFRKIRQKLLSQNRFTRYLAYAIGEIFLVVIGILIALQINTWNENRKYRNQEADFYSDVISDLDKDLEKLDFLTEFHHNRIEILSTLLTYLRNPADKMGAEKFGILIEPLYYSEAATSYSTAFESAKSSGAFSNFRQKETLKFLNQYYADFEKVRIIMTSITDFINDRFEPVMATIPSYHVSINSGKMVMAEKGNSKFYELLDSIKDNRIIKSDHEKVLYDPHFEAYVIGDMGRCFNLISRIETRKENLLLLKAQINEHL